MRRDLARPAILGGFDGAASLLGVIIYLLATHPHLIFPAALSGAISSALSMAAGQWLSDDNDSGFAGASMMGAATFTGALAPALPFAFLSGPAAVALAVIIAVAIGVAVAALRPNRGFGRALAEVFGLLIVIVGVCSLLSPTLPGGAG